MALKPIEKLNIIKYLNSHAYGDMYYLEMRDLLGRRKNAVSDLDYLEFFTDYVVKEFRKDEKFSNKLMEKLLSSVSFIFQMMHDNEQEVPEEVLDKIRSFNDFYEDYLIRTGEEKVEVLYTDFIKPLLDDVNDFYPSDVSGESISKYITKVAELESTIKKLEKDFNEAIRMNNILEKDKEKKEEQIDTLNESLKELQSDVRNKNKNILGLSNTILSLEEKIIELSNALQMAESLNLELGPFKEKYEQLSAEVKVLQDVIFENDRVKREENSLAEKHTSMEALLYQKLLFSRVNVDELVKFLQQKDINTDNKEVVSVLNSMKRFITLDNSVFSTQPHYKVIKPTLKKDGEFAIDVPYGCKHYDLMLVSDMHIQEMNGKVLRGFDAIMNYCDKNNINLVLNLGDFFHGTGSHLLTYNGAVSNYKRVEEAINLIPKQDGLYYALLGGNHDKNLTEYGFDPIKMMADNRSDFIDLGYTHSTVSLNCLNSKLGCFDIYHPDEFCFPIYLEDDGFDMDGITSYLEDIYSKQGRSRDDSYIDIFGHTHRSQFNYLGGYCYIPSFIDDSARKGEGSPKRGACHLRIYFDEDTDIKYMVFMPLNYCNASRITKNNEIIYQKVKKQ